MTLAIAFASLIVHELAHAWTAAWLGDSTGRHLGRLSLNPLRHVHPIATIAVPIASWILSAGAIVIGGGRAVPVDVLQLRGGVRGYAVVVMAGPAANLLLVELGLALDWPALVAVNLGLALFNLLPLPPLDGWNLVRAWRASRRLS